MPTDPLRAELLRLREIVCEEDAEAIDRALAHDHAVLSVPPAGSDPVAAFDRLMERCGDLVEEREHLSCRGESSAAGVVTKRIDRAGGASEVSFYAIGPKRSTHAEAEADLERFVGSVEADHG